MSQKTRVKFTIKESGDGVPYLHMEFLDSILGLPDQPPAFYLRAGTQMQEAEEIALYLNSNLAEFQPFPQEPAHQFQTEVKI